MHRWDYEPSFAERIAACSSSDVKVPALINNNCVHRSCTKCVTDMDWDVLLDLMRPDGESQVYYGIDKLEESKNMGTDAGREAVQNIQRELMDTCISITMWQKDVDTSAIALVDAFVNANLLAQQQPLLQAAGICLKWSEYKAQGTFRK